MSRVLAVFAVPEMIALASRGGSISSLSPELARFSYAQLFQGVMEVPRHWFLALRTSIIGAMIAQHFGWRAAFLAVGLPGLALALIFRMTIREPVRGGLDPPGAAVETPSLAEVIRHLASKPAFVHVAAGATQIQPRRQSGKSRADDHDSIGRRADGSSAVHVCHSQ